jgi:hypothetical protein
MSVVDDSYGYDLKPEEHATTPLAGGLAQLGYQCGQVWGAALAAGARAHELYGPGALAQAAALHASCRLIALFGRRYTHVNCSDLIGMKLTNVDLGSMAKYVAKGGPVKCFSMTAGFASATRAEIDAALAEPLPGRSAAPVSCATLLAQRRGASERHATMLAGFAGGVGLSGEGCGALGAALWLAALDEVTATGKVDYPSPKGMTIVEKFLTAIDGDFECGAIVGRKFVGPADHARYIASGGCARIIDALSTA